LPSVASIVVTFLILRFLSNKLLQGKMKLEANGKPLSTTGKLTLYGIALLAATLMTASALDVDLGAPAFAVGLLVAICISFRDHSTPRDVAKDISWSVLPLVAGLFVIVEALNSAGALRAAVRSLQAMKESHPLFARAEFRIWHRCHLKV
jgi:arsenical pump membrane protein